jgi:hypothetical protein
MSHELFYTSAPAGIKPGSKGFCTVACTSGIPAQLMERLESLSGYRYLFEPGSPQASQNPVSWAHWRLTLQGKMRSILSRVCDAGSDYSGRSNKFAHHVALEPNELSGCGPGYLLTHGFLEESWTGSPRTITSGRSVPSAQRLSGICNYWGKVTGDAGWGGVLAESFLADPSRPAFIICAPTVDVLALFEEALALLPEATRWQVTFNTYFTDLPAGLTCAWRGVVAGTKVALDAIKQGNRALVIDTSHAVRCNNETPMVEFARTGVPIERKERAQPISDSLLGFADQEPARSAFPSTSEPPLELAESAESKPNVVIVEREIPVGQPERRAGIPVWAFITTTIVAALFFGTVGVWFGKYLGSESVGSKEASRQAAQSTIDTSGPPPTTPKENAAPPADQTGNTAAPSPPAAPLPSDEKAMSVSPETLHPRSAIKEPKLTLIIDPSTNSKPLPISLSDIGNDRISMEISLPRVSSAAGGEQLLRIPGSGKNIPELKLSFVWESKKLKVQIPGQGTKLPTQLAKLSLDGAGFLTLEWDNQTDETVDPLRRQCARILSAAKLKFKDGSGKVSQTEVAFALTTPLSDETLTTAKPNDSYAGSDLTFDLPFDGMQMFFTSGDGKQILCTWSDDTKLYGFPGQLGHYRAILGDVGPDSPQELRCALLSTPINMTLTKEQYFIDFTLIPKTPDDSGFTLKTNFNANDAISLRQKLRGLLNDLATNTQSLDSQIKEAENAAKTAIRSVNPPELRTEKKIEDKVSAEKSALNDGAIKNAHEAILKAKQVRDEGSQLPSFKIQVDAYLEQLDRLIERMARTECEIRLGDIAIKRVRVDIPQCIVK